jgi:charged multivesicular body protein 2A
MDMKEEMMNDTLDDVMDAENEEQESDEIINQVLDDIGINLTSQLADTPAANGALGTQAQPAKVAAMAAGPIAAASDADLELQSRLDALKKS